MNEKNLITTGLGLIYASAGILTLLTLFLLFHGYF